MQLLPLLLISNLLALPVPAQPIILYEHGLTCSRIYSEPAGWEEQVVGDNAVDGAGNYYTIETAHDWVGEDSVSIIKRHTEAGEETVFGALNLPIDEGVFQALTFDSSGNMIVAVVSGMEGTEWRWRNRDYYLIKGLPEPEYKRRSKFIVGLGVLMAVTTAYFFSVFRVLRRESMQ